MFSLSKPANKPSADNALPDREETISVSNKHYVNGNPIKGPFASHLETATFAMGCFWGVEKKFWEIPGVFSTAVGYAGGGTRNANYKDVCSGFTGHAEVVLVVFDPQQVSYGSLLNVFWESHDPTQGMRQGNDQGTQYRSAIYAYGDDQLEQANSSRTIYQQKLEQAGFGAITTDIIPAPEFFYAENYHQQYLAKKTNGYCGIGGTGVSCG